MPVVCMSWTGPDHRIVAMNAACQAFVGRSGVIGLPFRGVFPDLAGQQIYELLDRVYATGQAQTGQEWRLQLDRGGDAAEDVYLDFTVVPLRAADGTVGGLLGTGIDVTARVLQREAARRDAAEAERRYRAARDVVAELQQALLPTALPVLPRVQVAARYLVASDEQAAGGDWFDAIPLADGTVALVVGDVVGHGVAASAAMGQLRAVLNELLAAEPDLATVLTRADRFAAQTPPLRAATMALVLLDPVTGSLRYTACGHPAPLILGQDGTSRFLPATDGGPLGTGSVPVLATATLRPGELLLLYSDGLIERPNRPITDGMAELARVAGDAAANRAFPARAAAAPADRVCQLTVELLTRTGYADDVTTLAAQLLPHPIAPLNLDLPAEVTSLHAVRHQFLPWLARAAPAEDDSDALHLAVIEVVSNAIEHAYPPGMTGRFQLHAELCADGHLACRITDQGRWQVPDPAAEDRGHGLMVASHSVDQLRVRHPPPVPGTYPGSHGTIVLIRHQLHRPAFLASEASPSTHAPADLPPFAVNIHGDGDSCHASVQGPVDITTAGQLARRLLAASRGGTLPVTVDLAGVTHLASAGVQVFYQLNEQLAAHQQTLTLRVPPSGPAHAVLDLVRLPYATNGATLNGPGF
jgi:serine phosphatase RsbU (regulator of sigma subunit)/anti-sigma regulatory factor (Ser/Thr protein kinase)/anti-anti-sigma regulatory factor